jgi:hypothetical protein
MSSAIRTEKDPGLRADALGLVESVIMGVAGSGPAYSVAVSTATLIAAAWVASHAPECTELTVEGDRGFESGSLQRGVCLTGAFHGCRRKGPAFAGSVSLGETRERDVLATSRLALAAFL